MTLCLILLWVFSVCKNAIDICVLIFHSKSYSMYLLIVGMNRFLVKSLDVFIWFSGFPHLCVDSDFYLVSSSSLPRSFFNISYI